jgi:hypothetical protein
MNMAGGIPTSFQIGAKVSPATAAARYKAAAGSAGTKWATQYLMSKVDPFQAASDAADTWLANINTAGTAGFKAGLGRVNKARVATLVSTSGPQLYSQGIANKGSVNYESAATGLIPALQQAAANLPPRGTAAQNDQRMLAMVAASRALKYQYRSK